MLTCALGKESQMFPQVAACPHLPEPQGLSDPCILPELPISWYPRWQPKAGLPHSSPPACEEEDTGCAGESQGRIILSFSRDPSRDVHLFTFCWRRRGKAGVCYLRKCCPGRKKPALWVPILLPSSFMEVWKNLVSKSPEGLSLVAAVILLKWNEKSRNIAPLKILSPSHWCLDVFVGSDGFHMGGRLQTGVWKASRTILTEVTYLSVYHQQIICAKGCLSCHMRSRLASSNFFCLHSFHPPSSSAPKRLKTPHTPKAAVQLSKTAPGSRCRPQKEKNRGAPRDSCVLR